MKLLEYFFITRHWHSVLYTYVSRSDRHFWGMESAPSFLQKWCSIIEYPIGKVTENMYWVQPALIRKGYGKVFLLLDDIKLQASPGSNWFPLDKLIQVMESNNLTVISPLVRANIFPAIENCNEIFFFKISRANKVGGNKFRYYAHTPPYIPSHEGRGSGMQNRLCEGPSSRYSLLIISLESTCFSDPGRII